MRFKSVFMFFIFVRILICKNINLKGLFFFRNFFWGEECFVFLVFLFFVVNFLLMLRFLNFSCSLFFIMVYLFWGRIIFEFRMGVRVNCCWGRGLFVVVFFRDIGFCGVVVVWVMFWVFSRFFVVIGSDV